MRLYRDSNCVTGKKLNNIEEYGVTAISCESTIYCQPGTCISSDGVCKQNVEREVCKSQNGLFVSKPIDQVSECKVGCCDLPNGASLTSKSQCAAKIREFPGIDLKNVFKPDIIDQDQCLQQSKSSEEGCCVLQDSCQFITRASCNQNGQDTSFYSGTLCSKPSLGCRVTPKQGTTCYNNKVYWIDSDDNRENIYDGDFDPSWENENWRSSANLDLDVPDPSKNDFLDQASKSGNCDYIVGTTCSDITDELKTKLNEKYKPNQVEKISKQCLDLNCKTELYDKKISKQNGESWCEYQSQPGQGQDLVGSRHIINKCENGIVKRDFCGERRSEVCVQNDIPINGKKITAAKCVPNEFQVCLALNNDNLPENSNCGLSFDEAKSMYEKTYNGKIGFSEGSNEDDLSEENINDSPCGIWLIGSSEDGDQSAGVKNAIYEGKATEFKECIVKTMCKKVNCEERILGHCYFNKEIGLCSPNVPPGSLGKENEQKYDLDFVYENKAIWIDEGIFRDWNCEENCQARTSEGYQPWSNYCSSRGDFGLKFNAIGKKSPGEGSFSITGPFDVDYDAFDIGDPEDFTNPDDNLYMGVDGKPEFYPSSYQTTDIQPLTQDFYTMFQFADILKSYKIDLSQVPVPERWNALWISLGSFSIIFISSLTYSAGFWVITPAFFAAGIATGTLVAISIVSFLVIAIILIIFVILEFLDDPEIDEVIYKYTCSAWIPPYGGDDCSRCNDKELFPQCDEYICKSLGQSCELINKDENGPTGKEACVSRKVDPNPPIIKAASFITKDKFKLNPPDSGTLGGYELTEPLPPFTPIKIGINIVNKDDKNDFAICKISKFDLPYESSSGQQMTEFFSGNSLQLSEHIRMLKPASNALNPNEDIIELENGKINTFYVRCVNAKGNSNLKSYYIRIPVQAGPDTAPPVITQFDPLQNSPIKYNLEKIRVNIYVDENSELIKDESQNLDKAIGGCKYSTIETDNFDSMTNLISCAKNKIKDIDKYICTTELQLKPNQDNKFYFACRDASKNTYPGNQPYILRSTQQPLKISQTGPNGDVFSADITLTAATEGGSDNGKSKCYYSQQNAFSSQGLIFRQTDSDQHSTLLPSLRQEEYKFYIWCRDAAGNEDNKEINFKATTPDLFIKEISLINDTKFYSDKVELSLITIGGIKNNGDSLCSYDLIKNGDNFAKDYLNDDKIIKEAETIFYENLTNLQDGNYNLKITCSDAYKSDTINLKFAVDTKGTPQLIRLFKENNLLNIITNREAECHYSPTEKQFNFEQGTLMVTTNNLQHSLQIANSNVFYIKCMDLNTKQISNPYSVYP